MMVLTRDWTGFVGVTGDNYLIRHDLKALGCEFDWETKTWMAPQASHAAAQRFADKWHAARNAEMAAKRAERNAFRAGETAVKRNAQRADLRARGVPFAEWPADLKKTVSTDLEAERRAAFIDFDPALAPFRPRGRG